MRISRRKPLRLLFISALAAGAIWISGVRLFAFPGESMAPAVKPGDYFVGLVGLWHLRTPQRFDLAIYDVPPHSKWADRKIPWMKRIVGLPGERVRLAHGQLLIDGRPTATPFLRRDSAAKPADDFDILLKQDEYFVLGDNLDHSFDDSRSMGPIRKSLMKGVVAFVIHRS